VALVQSFRNRFADRKRFISVIKIGSAVKEKGSGAIGVVVALSLFADIVAVQLSSGIWWIEIENLELVL
jgi:hypothetical protein